jgi:hypothetical protein
VSGRPARRLRIAAAAQAEPHPPVPEPLRLLSALSATGQPGRAHAVGGALELRHELRLPGLGARYLAGLADHAQARGWEPAEVAALLDAIEQRSAMWVVCPSAAALRRAGLIAAGRGRRRACAHWASGRWSRVPVDVGALAAATAAGRSGAVCAAAVSGRGAPARIVAAVAGAGVRSGSLAAGLAAPLRVAWTVELLVAPALPAGSLMALRERVAAAPRCGWCGVPMLTGHCRRCQPGGPP